MTPLEALADCANPQKAAEMARYHKAERPYLGVSNPDINDLTKAWRHQMDIATRLHTAEVLWDSNIHEARIAAAKLITQARIRPDCAVWALINRWVPEFDAWAIADHACKAGERRIMADLSRLDTVADWTISPHKWTRRAALVMTLPLTKSNHPSAEESAARDRVLEWAAAYVPDRDWFIQKAIAWWVRSLSQHDPDRARKFLAQHGDGMKAFARKDAGRHLAAL